MIPAIVDLFCGGGGASEGIRMALGRAPDIAVNHDPQAIAMHAENHRATIHVCKSVHDPGPLGTVRGRHVKLLWLSPDCTHHSRAKGGKPRKQEIRDLAWIAIEWAAAVRPDVIALENVPEFEDWGPLDEQGKPIAHRRGETFREFVSALRGQGYAVEWRVLNAADYGAPTRRKRLFLVARCDGTPPAWPEPTHGAGRTLPHVPAAACIDWSIPCPSIFTRRRPLAPATERRIAEGLRRYVLTAARPFLIRTDMQSDGRLRGIAGLDEPLRTVTTAGGHALIAPHIVATGHQSGDGGKVRGADEPLSTIVTKAEHCLVAPSLVQLGYGEREGQAPRVLDLGAPLGTIVAGGGKHGLVTAHLQHLTHGGRTHDLGTPLPTVTAAHRGEIALVAHDLVEGRPSNSKPTAAWIAKHYGGVVGHGLERSLGTVTAIDHHGLATAELSSDQQGTNKEPTTDHRREVAAFLVKYYGSQVGQHQAVDEPLHTIVQRARFGLVTVELDGVPYTVVDIGLRMLQPRELARAQGFGDDYVLVGTKAQQIARIGNSVPPQVVAAVVRAQFPGDAQREAA